MSAEDPTTRAALVTVESVAENPGPVLGARRKGQVTLPRKCLSLIAGRIKGRLARLVFLQLPFSSGFHPSGLWNPDIAELADFLGVSERSVRSALTSLHAQGVVCWAPTRGVIFSKDAAHWSIYSEKVARNVHVRLADFVDSEPVRAARLYYGLDRVSADGSTPTVHRLPSTAHPSPPTPNGRTQGPTSTRRIKLEGLSYDYFVSIPASITDAELRRSMEGDRALTIEIATQALLTCQAVAKRELDDANYVRRQVAARFDDDGWSLLHMMRRVAVRVAESDTKRDARGLCTPSCFWAPDEGGNAATTDVMVSKAFDDEHANHMALEEWRGGSYDE